MYCHIFIFWHNIMFDNNSRVLIRNCHPQLIIIIIFKKKRERGGRVERPLFCSGLVL
jgi:hypothetical protein